MKGSSGRGYLTRMGFRNVIKNSTMSIASVLVLVSCLMLIGLVFMAAVNLNAIFSQVSSHNVIMAFLVPGLEPSQIDELALRIEQLDNVSQAEFISSEKAYERAKANNAGDFALLDGVDQQFMPDGFVISPIRQEEFLDTVALLENFDPAITLPVRHVQGVAAQLSALGKALTIFGIAVISVLMLVSVFIISSTVQATMYSRQQEIKVMKSVGAAPAFIRWPFMVEGVALGVIGSVLALGVVFLVYVSMGSALEPLLGKLLTGYTLVPFGNEIDKILPAFLLVGVITGGGGSMLSITRYLKEKVYEKSELDQA